MPTDSRSRFPDGCFTARALVVILAGALAGCGARDTEVRAESAAGATSTTTTPAQPSTAPQPVLPDTTAFTPPRPALQGQPNVEELVVTIEPVAYDSIAPAELLVTDPRGRRVGMEPVTWRPLLETHNTTYDSMPPLTQTDGDPEPGGLVKQIDLITPLAGHYVLQVIGRRAGTYTLTVKLVTPRDESRVAKLSAQKIRPGEIHVFRFTHEEPKGPLTLRRQ